MSATYAQPFVACDFEGGWTATVNTQTTYDWVANQWSVPLLASVSKLVRMGSQPVSVSAGVRYWAASPDSGPHGAGGRLSISFVFP